MLRLPPLFLSLPLCAVGYLADAVALLPGARYDAHDSETGRIQAIPAGAAR
jgi:hypothetical protein